MKFKLNILLAALLVCGLSSCAWFDSNSRHYSDFDTNPDKYKTAKMTKDITIPNYLAQNIENQPLYPIPQEKDLSGDLNVRPVPPNLLGKITE